MNRRVEYEMMKTGQPFFTVLKPYVDTQLRGNARQDSLNLFEEPGTKSQDTGLAVSLTPNPLTRNTWFKRKLYYESFVQVDSGDYYLFFDPVFELGLGKEISDRNTYINTRGFRAGGRLGKNFAFGVDFYESQGLFNTSVTSRIKKLGIAPSEGLPRKYDSIGFDFAHSTGYVSFNLNKLNIILAQGRQFIGDGYRSMFLSDASYPYPYLRLTWTSPKFFYNWDNILIQDLGMPMAGRKNPIRRKSVTVHNIGFKIKNKVQFTLVKMQLYNNPDSFGKYTVRINQLNPILIPDFKDKDKQILGTNIKVALLPSLSFYNQLSCDNIFSNEKKRLSMQFGVKFVKQLRAHLLYFQTEYNRIPPLAYTSSDKIYNWLNFREPIAHPLGHNFDEFIFISSWTYKRFQFYVKAANSKQLKTISDVKPFAQASLPYYLNDQKVGNFSAEFSYFFNSKTLMNINLGYNYRDEHLSDKISSMHYIYFSFGTRLFNRYYDF